MFEDCKQYTKEKEKGAPTVCVEGVNNSQGSHGVIHDRMEKLMKIYRISHPDKDSISNSDAIDAAIQTHQETFKPPCDEHCLKAQLKSFYDKLCAGKMKPRGGKGTDIDESSATTTPTRIR